MSKGNISGEIIKDYLERYPKSGTRSLSRKIYKENKKVYKDEEQVRSLMRYYLGQNGNTLRKGIKYKKFVRPSIDSNPYGIHESECIPWKPVRVPKHLNNGLLFSDPHFPYHDIGAINSMLDYVVGHKKINFIIINGDGMDCYQGSRFNKDPRNRSINDELWIWIGFLQVLQKTFPGVKIFWKLGNHEERWENYLRIRAPELIDMDEFKFGEIIKIRGIENVEVVEKQIMYAARLPIIHGHEFANKSAGPVNPARGLFLKTLSSAIVSHHHRSSAHSVTDINGKLMSWWSLGCLCSLHPEWALINEWNHGFALIETEGLDFEMQNHKIYAGKVYRD